MGAGVLQEGEIKEKQMQICWRSSSKDGVRTDSKSNRRQRRLGSCKGDRMRCEEEERADNNGKLELHNGFLCFSFYNFLIINSQHQHYRGSINLLYNYSHVLDTHHFFILDIYLNLYSKDTSKISHTCTTRLWKAEKHFNFYNINEI